MATYTLLQLRDIQSLADYYQLSVDDFEPIEAGAGNTNYLLQTQQGLYTLTIFEDKTVQHVTQIAQLLRLLVDRGFPTTRLRLPAEGSPVLHFGNKPVLVKEYISGRVYAQLGEIMLEQVGVAMAKLHQVPSPDSFPDRHSYSIEIFTSSLGHGLDPAFERWLEDRLDTLARAMSPDLPRGLIHGDVFFDNVIFEGESLKAVIDFEQACCHYKAFDVGVGIVGMCTENSAIDLSKARALLRGYQSVRKLEDRERESMQSLVDYAATATSSWRFWKNHLDVPDPQKANRHHEMMRLANSVNAIPRERFLAAIFDG